MSGAAETQVGTTVPRTIDGLIGALERREGLLWLLVLVGAVGDCVTTGLGLQVGLVEGNPFIQGLIHDYGIWTLALAKLPIVLLGWLTVRMVDHPGRVVVPLGFATPWMAATVANFVLIVSVAT